MERLCMGCMEKYDDSFEVCPHCGYAFNTPPKQSYHIEPGSVLQQRYIVGKVLGFGGFGVTYLGWDYLMERKVAIKEYLPSEFATRMPTQQQVTVYSGDKEEQFQEGLRKTIDEARRLARFEAVPGIVQIYDCFEANGTSYIVMEYLEGMSLKQYIAEKGKMTVEQASGVIQQVAAAMATVHRSGILHRDIAPDNIYVLNPDEPDHLQVKLLDFGAARYATTKHSKSLSVIIKPGYAPEEQYRSRGDQGTWTDVYALAATLYKMLTGITPEDAMERSVKDDVKRPSKLGIKISKPMETALMNALNVKIQDRTQTMEEFSQELMSAEVKERQITKTKKDIGAMPKWVIGLAAVGIVAAAAVGVLIGTGKIPVGIGWGHSQIDANMARVPNVVNHDAEEAETMLSNENLGMNRDRVTYSEEIPANLVSYQEIPAGSTVEKNTDVVVWISLGERTGVIPSLIGRQREDAEEMLKAAGFEVIVIKEDAETEGSYNAVIGISEEVGSSVSLKTEITITVCMNEDTREGDTSEQVEVPDVSGMSREEINILMEETGLHVTWIEEYDDYLEAGAVISQSPEAGKKANKDSYIEIHISQGVEQVYLQLENVLYQPQSDAEAAIKAQNLSIGNTRSEYSESVSAGNVIRVLDGNGKEAENGTSLDKGSTLTLVISKGKDPAKQTTTAQRETNAPTETATQAPEMTAAPVQTEAATQEPETTEAPPVETEATVVPTQAPAAGQGTPDINW